MAALYGNIISGINIIWRSVINSMASA